MNFAFFWIDTESIVVSSFNVIRDWYNLEKSKRVKPFRCGDFDDCIERVESSQGLTIRKREKYARREDAILHALELEKEMLKKEGKLVSEKPRDNSPDATKERMVISRVQDNSNGARESTDSLGHVSDVVHLLKDKEEDQPSCEDEVVPRMRGLQDFGLRTASSKRKFSCSNGPDTSLKSLARSNSPASSSGDQSMERPSYTLGKMILETSKCVISRWLDTKGFWLFLT